MQPHSGTKQCSIESLSPVRRGGASQRELPLKAPVFNVQKFSLDDGPGIRTVVFLKGCPLRCAWCANPESQLAYSQLEWDGRSCKGCGCCAAASQAVALAFDEGGLPQVTVDHVCLAAEKRQPQVAEACVWGAMSLVGAERSVDEVVAQCLQDQAFYEQSGGGVTFSGGEALLWPDFVRQAARRLHAQGVSCAMETTGYAAPEVFEQVLDAMDILLFDVKHWDEAAHKAGTGVGLGLIKDNLRRACASGAQVLCRTPVIPGSTSTRRSRPAQWLPPPRAWLPISSTPGRLRDVQIPRSPASNCCPSTSLAKTNTSFWAGITGWKASHS